MAATRQKVDEQTKLWNGSAGCAWVEAQALLDRTLQPFEDLLVEAVAASGARRVLDVGCGTGSTTRAFARLVGAGGRSVGIDISEQMVDAARMLAEQERAPATFICADAQTHAFEPASFDLITSRFGVMFFTDPVQAFANLRQAAASDARLCFVAWRSAADNPFMTTAERAAAPLLPNLQARVANAPGQFGFARRAAGAFHPGGERLDGDRDPADRRALHAARERVERLCNSLRACRRGSPRSGPADSRAGRRDRPRGVRAVRARRRSALHRLLLDGSCSSLTHLRDLVEHVDVSHHGIGDARDLGVGRIHHVILVGRMRAGAVTESEMSGGQRYRRRGEIGARP